MIQGVDDLNNNNFPLIAAVGMGSEKGREPRVAVVDWNNNNNNNNNDSSIPLIVVIGKGINNNNNNYYYYYYYLDVVVIKVLRLILVDLI